MNKYDSECHKQVLSHVPILKFLTKLISPALDLNQDIAKYRAFVACKMN